MEGQHALEVTDQYPLSISPSLSSAVSCLSTGQPAEAFSALATLNQSDACKDKHCTFNCASLQSATLLLTPSTQEQSLFFPSRSVLILSLPFSLFFSVFILSFPFSLPFILPYFFDNFLLKSVSNRKCAKYLTLCSLRV